jgi:hypothetical protein
MIILANGFGMVVLSIIDIKQEALEAAEGEGEGEEGEGGAPPAGGEVAPPAEAGEENKDGG